MDVNDKIEFLKSGVEHIENRIQVMDQKASILMAIQAGFYVLIASILDNFIGIFKNLSTTPLIIGILSFLVLITGLLLSFYVVYYLIMTIRPGKGILSNVITDEVTGAIPVDKYVFWFKNKQTYLTDEEYINIIDHLDENVIIDNYKKAHFTGLKLLSQKYHFYRKAIKGMNIFIIINMLGTVFLVCYSGYHYISNLVSK